MKRDYVDGVKDDVVYFTGMEIERTPAFGLMTLFVVGIQDPNEIIEVAKKEKCEAIYFGANQSFPNPEPSDVQWSQWEDMIIKVLTSYKVYCTLDVDAKCVNGLLETKLVEHNRFIPMISVKLPYLQQLNYNTTIKIDDIDFDATNPGIWCHSLTSLLDRKNFTSWCEYKNDKPI